MAPTTTTPVPVTEFATALLTPSASSSIEDDSSSAAQVFSSCRALVSTLPGFQRQYWGLKIETYDEDTDEEGVRKRLLWGVDWDDVSAHHAFIADPSYKSFMTQIGAILDAQRDPPSFTHAAFSPWPPNDGATREAAVTEVGTFTFPPDVDRKRAQDAVATLLHAISTGYRGTEEEEGVKEAKGTAMGWVVEGVEHPDVPVPAPVGGAEEEGKGAEGGKAVGLTILVGWETVEEHMKMRGTEAFGEGVKGVRELMLKPLGGKRGMCHVKFRRG